MNASALMFFIMSCYSCNENPVNPEYLAEALNNGRLANEGFRRCQRFVHAWLEYSDPATGLIPENLNEGIDNWNAHNSAADNYPFMVLTAAITDSTLFHGRMLEMLETETRLTSRLGNLPDTYSFSKKSFANEEVDLGRIIFGASEYVKDGLLPLTEWLGESPWSERMIGLIDDIWANAPVATKYGAIPSTNVEINGEQLQILSRVYWMTGDDKYLDWALRLGDYYLLDGHHPDRDFDVLRLRDHGCEIISGLCELYATVHHALPEKKKLYEKPIHDMLDRILEIGVNEHGMFYNSVNPKTGEIIDSRVADTYGYTYNGFYTVYLIDKTEKYRDAMLYTFSNLHNYRDFDWERGGSADGFADAIESALNLYNREPGTEVEKWLDSETKIMWSLQDSSYKQNAQKWKGSGIIEGWHGDGNFARTAIMYCLWKTQGVTIAPWREDIIFGAVRRNDTLFVAIKADADWQGRILFDTARHKTIMNLPFDWPRINQFPEWFTVDTQRQYDVENLNTNSSAIHAGSDLQKGIRVELTPGATYMLTVKEI